MDVPSNEGLVVLLLSKRLKRKACSETSIFETVILDVVSRLFNVLKPHLFSEGRPSLIFAFYLG
jgi:hypothetical protein